MLTFSKLVTAIAIMLGISKSNASAHHKLLLISFDGMRWDYPDRAAQFQAFQYLKSNGVKAKFLQAVFPTLTSPSHFTLATGLYPESHGVVHNCYYNSSDASLRPPNFFRTLEINEWWDNGAEPIWITAVNQGLKSGGIYFPGSYATINGVSATVKKLETVSTPMHEKHWRSRIDETMQLFAQENLDMIALYFEQADIDSHWHGPNDDTIIKSTLPLVNRTIMYLMEQVEKHNLKDDLNIIITSDHGFETIDTKADREEIIELSKYVNHSLIDYQFAYGPLGLIEPTPGSASYVVEQLRKGNPHMDVYLKEDIPERFHYKNNDRIPSIVIVSEPGYLVYWTFPLFHLNAGEHGFDNDLVNMRTIYYSIGPSFKKGYEIEGFDSVNIYPLMCHLLGLNPAPNNGSLDVLRETLSDVSKECHSKLGCRFEPML